MGLSKKQLTILAFTLFIVFDVGAYFFIKNTIEGHAHQALTAYDAGHSDITITYDKLSSSPLTKSMTIDNLKVSGLGGEFTVQSARMEGFKATEDGGLTARVIEAENISLQDSTLPGPVTAKTLTLTTPLWAGTGDWRFRGFEQAEINGLGGQTGGLGDVSLSTYRVGDGQIAEPGLLSQTLKRVLGLIPE